MNFPTVVGALHRPRQRVDASTSVAEKVKTAVLFSGRLLVAGGDVITGASLTLVTLTVTVCVSLS